MTSYLSDTLAPCVDCGKPHPASARVGLLPSPFQSIVQQAVLPTTSETAAIRDYIRDTDGEIARILCEVTQLRRSSERHAAAIAPIRRVPPEVIAEIFMQFSESEAGMQTSMKYDELQIIDKAYTVRPCIHKFPLIFGEICAHWRAIALSCPKLWNSISLQCRNTKLQTNISLCDLWLKRSGSLPLSIRFYREYGEGYFTTKEHISHFQDLIRTILPHANRWRSLELRNLPAPSYRVLDDLLPGSVSRLEHLFVVHHFGEIMKSTIGTTPWVAVRIAPKLTCLQFDRIGGASVRMGREQSTFPCSQLTHIDLGDCSSSDCLHILANAPSAIVCVFIVTTASPFLEDGHIFHLQLQTLKITARSRVGLHFLWSRLTCSALSTISIDINMSNPDVAGVQDLPQFLTRSGGTIEKFTLRGSGHDDTQFMTCLRGMPLLRRMAISETGTGTQLTDRVWDALVFTLDTGEESSPLIPNLESLSLDPCLSFSHRSLVRMLESRVPPLHSSARRFPLKLVDLTIGQKMSESAYKRVMRFEKRGLSIYIEEACEDDDSTGSEVDDDDEENSDDSGESGDSDEDGSRSDD
ncbi:hypothetical protein B0H17DRAFT_138901 [Mycena rosella]|uniref:F-box domain-containing protein n=1 Tax=Mycena rosella TaxID=1033263 RepID=A0AAD7E044_MYCRO|nr:hypothetical protein B0H17DRAFT_138901 [Mycena rosella]